LAIYVRSFATRNKLKHAQSERQKTFKIAIALKFDQLTIDNFLLYSS
jgi:hypothetical protein